MKQLNLVELIQREVYLKFLKRQWDNPKVSNHLNPRIDNLTRLIYSHPSYLSASTTMRWILGLTDWKNKPIKR